MLIDLKILEQQAMKHIMLRWVGAPLFTLGLFWLFTAFRMALQNGTWYPVMIAFASSMMGLTCFGLNHDTAIELSMKIRAQDSEFVFQEPLQREVSEEVERDYANALALSGHPTLGIVLPVITVLVHSVVVYLLWFAG